MLYQKSDFLQSVAREDGVLIWHSLFGNPLVVSPSTLDFLAMFKEAVELDAFYGEYSIDDQQDAIIKVLVENHFLVPDRF